MTIYVEMYVYIYMYIIFITSPFPNFLRPDSSLSSALVVNLVFEVTKPK